MTDVFISYPRKDVWIMRTLRAEIEKAHFSVWADEKLEPGHQSWMENIRREIEDAVCVVVIITTNTKSSEWIEKEVMYADARKKVVIPVFVSKDPTDIPFLLVGKHGVELHSDFAAGVVQLCAYIHRIMRPNTPLRTDRVGSLYWLGADLGQLYCHLPTQNFLVLKRFLRQICHHARRLELPSEFQERLCFLRDSTVLLSELEWTEAKRYQTLGEVDRLIGDIALSIIVTDPDWEPFDSQNIREGLT